jgi:hypothetical protein
VRVQCWGCSLIAPVGPGERNDDPYAYTAAHVDLDDGEPEPCAERYDYYTPDDQAANLEALLAEIESWPT